MTRRLLLILAATSIFAASAGAQSREEMLRLYPWVDTTGESGVYPIGEAVDVYRAVFDLLYKDGDKRPSVIVVLDTIEIGGERPCPIKCDRVWYHKSKMDTSTILAFARQSPKRPRFRRFSYNIPIALVSYDDIRRMDHEGKGYLAEHNLPNTLPGRAAQVGFSLKFPGAWGLAQLGKVGFNTRHTEALVQVHHSCIGMCGSNESVFLKRLRGRWTVIERIPTYAEASGAYGTLRYRGPAGYIPAESEIVADARTGPVKRSDSKDADAVYRAVLDSLYSFQGASPSMVILTDRFRGPGDTLSSLKTRVDPDLLQRYKFLETAHVTPDSSFRYRVPVRIVFADSTAELERIGAPIARQTGMDAPFWLGLGEKFPGAWGMVGFTRVAFNLPHTQAMVYTNHQCGPNCDNGDTWVVSRSGESWHVVERIPRGSFGFTSWEPTFFPLRYIGLEAKPNSYRHRHAFVRFTNAVTRRPPVGLLVRTAELFNNGSPAVLAFRTTDSAGRIDLGTMPFMGVVEMMVPCPDQSEPDSLYAGSYAIDPGPDTTVTIPIDFQRCFRKSEARLMPTGAQAFISRTEARFVFPFRPASESWDLSARKTVPGVTDFFWTVDFEDDRRPNDPVALWLRASLQPNASATSLANLLSRSVLEPMLPCHTCDPSAVYAERKFDAKNIFARVDSGRIEFILRGRDAVRHLFPSVPAVVSFSTLVRHKPNGKPPYTDITESQTVLVNCRSSDSTAYTRRHCLAPDNAIVASPKFDSIGPRRVRIVALSYDGELLMRNLDVRILSADRKDSVVTKSTGAGGFFFHVQQPPDSIAVQALCPRAGGVGPAVSGELALYIAPGRDTTLQLLVDPRRCSR